MKTYRINAFLFVLGLLLAAPALRAYAKQAPEFPPGTFSDGKYYSLEQLRGQVVVLFFYEKNCPSCTRKIPDHNKIVAQFRGQPVTFIAIAAGDSADEAAAYAKRTGLAMPIFADKLSLMEKLYGIEISLKNIYQFRLIDPTGNIVDRSMAPEAIKRALANAKQLYNVADYHETLTPVINLLNQNQYKVAAQGLRRYLSSRDKDVKASAQTLNETLLEQAKNWVKQADEFVETDPIQARTLYSNASTLFSRESFSKHVRTQLKSLKSNSVIKDEAAARKMYAKMIKAVGQMKREQVPELVTYAKKIAEKYPDTPTGQRCARLVEGLE